MKDLLLSALQNATQQLGWPHIEVKLDRCRDKSHGDFSTNIAMILAKQMGLPPREAAQQLVAQLGQIENVSKIDIAGPGFINFHLAEEAASSIIHTILEQKTTFGQTNLGQGKRIHLEYVSSNPTGPLHVGHGRGAAYGSCLANLLQFSGFKVHREYYVNDAGRQMDILATSVWLRYLGLCDITLALM